MTEIGLLDIDLADGEGARLLAAVADRHPHLARAAERVGRPFLIRSPWAPGLRFVGAQVEGFSLAGGGLTVEDALTSCLGEAVERLSQVERPGDVTATGSMAALHDRLMPSVSALLRDLTGGGANDCLDWMAARRLDGEATLLPADWCLRRTADGPARIPGTALSTGCAAGPTVETAAQRALLELVERDAAALWWVGGRRPRALPSAVAAEFLRLLRAGSDERRTLLLDITTNIGLPAVAAVSMDRDGGAFTAGLGARTTSEDAARAALIELCQMEIGLQLAHLKQRRLGSTALNDGDRRHIARANGIKSDDPRLQPGDPPREEAPALPDELATVERALARAGIEAALVDLTRPDFGIATIKAVAPALQPLPGDVCTTRLRAALAESDSCVSAIIPIV